jgi:Tol biopolymer transport system component
MGMAIVHKRRRVALALSALLMISTSVIAAQPVSATPAGVNGRISFMRHDANGFWQIWTANPDLSASHQITAGAYDSGWPVWSPDATRLVFNSSRDDTQGTGAISDIFVMNADGSGVTKLTNSIGWSQEPAWSPTGDLIGFQSDMGAYPDLQGVYVIHPDGTGLRRVTSLPVGTRHSYYHAGPRFSPDGRSLEYMAIRLGIDTPNGYVGELSALYVVDLDGSNPHRITPWGIKAGDADWSPDGKHIVFEANPPRLGGGSTVMVVDADGRHLHSLTRDAGITGVGPSTRTEESLDPVWSPDGTKIMFSHVVSNSDGFQWGLQLISPNGTHRRWASEIRDIEHQADWGTAPLQ